MRIRWPWRRRREVVTELRVIRLPSTPIQGGEKIVKEDLAARIIKASERLAAIDANLENIQRQEDDDEHR